MHSLLVLIFTNALQLKHSYPCLIEEAMILFYQTLSIQYPFLNSAGKGHTGNLIR